LREPGQINVSIRAKIQQLAAQADASWGPAYPLFSRIIEREGLKNGAEIGVAFGGHSEAILKSTTIKRLYGVDPYTNSPGYDDPMNLPQAEFDELYRYTLERLTAFRQRFVLIRKPSKEAALEIGEKLDFVYIDADHSYNGVLADLGIWFHKIRDDGVIGGHDYAHPNFPGVRQAIDQFFQRFGWPIQLEGEGVWWVKKQALNISFIIPACNREKTLEQSIRSIIEGNLTPGDEIIVVNDASSDNTLDVLRRLAAEKECIRRVEHAPKRGGAAALNTAIEDSPHPLVFCLGADNVLLPYSVQRLKDFLISSCADIVALGNLHFFTDTTSTVSHRRWFRPRRLTVADYLSSFVVPGASGNYLFTRESWQRARRRSWLGNRNKRPIRFKLLMPAGPL
jgi:hypothetical protein